MRERKSARNVLVEGARPFMAKVAVLGQDQSTWRTRFSVRSRDRDSRRDCSPPD